MAEELYVKHGLTAPKMAEAALALLGERDGVAVHGHTSAQPALA
jgi:hypothetical protein